jgi:hypothetical protein
LIRDPALMKDFTLVSVLNAILKSAGVAQSEEERIKLLKTMLDSYRATSIPNPVSGLDMPVPARGEANFDPKVLLDPVNGMKPIGLFNRLDAAPVNFADCGEHRVVFAGPGDFFIIFEAKLPNPKPTTGRTGCKPVAAQWKKIGAAAPAAVPALLKQLYFTGLSGFVPVIRYQNYGGALGQVRTNSVAGGPWELREFRIDPLGASQLAFRPGTLNATPFPAFWRADLPGDSALQVSERKAFQDAFIQSHAAQLTAFDQTALDDANFASAQISQIGMRTAFRSNGFRNVSENGDEMVTRLASATLQQALPAESVFTGGKRKISRVELLNRAEASTCGGCHALAGGRPIGRVNGTVVTWPNALSFTHIRPNGNAKSNISDALTQQFLPFRMKTLAVALSATPTSRDGTVITTSQVDRIKLIEKMASEILAGTTVGAKSLGDYQAAVTAAREEDAATEGYFRPNRLPH